MHIHMYVYWNQPPPKKKNITEIKHKLTEGIRMKHCVRID